MYDHEFDHDYRADDNAREAQDTLSHDAADWLPEGD